MKSTYESADHQKIRAQKLLDQEKARELLGKKTGTLQKSTSDMAIHVLTDNLTGAERRERRAKAGVVKKEKISRLPQLSDEAGDALEKMAILGEVVYYAFPKNRKCIAYFEESGDSIVCGDPGGSGNNLNESVIDLFTKLKNRRTVTTITKGNGKESKYYWDGATFK